MKGNLESLDMLSMADLGAATMGEARRRRLASLTLDSADSFDAVRRFWRGRDPGPVNEFKAPTGTIAVTLDVRGASPTTYLLDVTKVTDAISEVDRITKSLNYYQIVRVIGTEFLKARQTDNNSQLEWIGLAALWSALHHPRMGGDMRKKVSASLRDKSNAHITWQFSSNTGLAIALADGFVDLEQMAASAPQDQVFGFDYTGPDDQGPSQH